VIITPYRRIESEELALICIPKGTLEQNTSTIYGLQLSEGVKVCRSGECESDKNE
jgi:hypothetical protein